MILFVFWTHRTIDEAGVENVSDMLPDTEYQYTPSLSQHISSVHGIFVVARTNMEYIKPATNQHQSSDPFCFQGVQAGRSGSGSTVISWMVDDDNSVVKYCQDNIVTIFVPGDSEDPGTEDSGGSEAAAELEIVASNTLRLRIVPCQDISGGPQL